MADLPDGDFTDVERAFNRAMAQGAGKLEREIGYKPNRWKRMVAEHGAVAAAKRLLQGSDVSEGFKKLWAHRCLDESVEWYVLAYWQLFTTEERRTAYERLKRYDVPVDRWLQDRLGRRWP
jgi:hypothetical protein